MFTGFLNAAGFESAKPGQTSDMKSYQGNIATSTRNVLNNQRYA